MEPNGSVPPPLQWRAVRHKIKRIDQPESVVWVTFESDPLYAVPEADMRLEVNDLTLILRAGSAG